MKILKPLPHAVIDYLWAGTMIAAPWIFGFHRNKAATTHAVASGAAILGLSLMTRYPLGAAKVIPFPTHGVIEAFAGVMTATAPWLMNFSDDRKAKLVHVMSGLGTLAVVAMTDYKAAEESYKQQHLNSSVVQLRQELSEHPLTAFPEISQNSPVRETAEYSDGQS